MNVKTNAINSTVATLTSFESFLSFLTTFNLILDAYLLSATLVLGLINNALCLLVFCFGKEFYMRTSKVCVHVRKLCLPSKLYINFRINFPLNF